MEAELDKQKLWKIKRVHNCWFLDAGGKLTRLTILKDASDVYLEDNIILADDLTYQLTVESDGQIAISKIEEICQKDYKNIDNNTDWLEQTQEENYELGSEEFVSIKDNKMIGGDAESDLEQENTLVLDSEVYKPKKGKIRGLFQRFKKTKNKSTSEADAVDGLCCSPKIQPLVQFRELEVSRESVKLLKKLGSGCFGEVVYAGKWRNTVDVAVKSLENCQMTVDDFLAEAELMVHLRHNKLVQLMAVCTKTEPILIITEYMINGTLLDYLHKDGGNSLSFDSLADMAGQIADGMAYLETVDCVHRDLRAANIFVGDRNEVKVTGFGLARLIQGDFYEGDRKTKFAVRWTEPEAAGYMKFSIKSDVWSYGVLLYELITFGRVPYPGMKNFEVFKRVLQGYRMEKPTGGPIPCPDAYYKIMLNCWNRVAASRPTFAYLHDFFDNYVVNVEEGYSVIVH